MYGLAATFCLGLWLMGTICVSVVAMQDFYTIDRLLADPGNDTFEGMVESIGRAKSRDFLRFLASELNRLFFQLWNWSQFLIGGATLWLVWRIPEPRVLRWSIIGMLGIVLVLTVLLTPQILAVGRSLDFVSRNPAPPSLRTFGILHATYTTLEMLKLAVGTGVVVWIVRAARRPAPLE